MEFHEYANLFPMIKGDEFDRLKEDIKKNGLIDDVITYEGKILDGRNRFMACESAGIEPRFTEYEGSDPLSYVISLNLHRRHLNESQRAMVAASVANMKQGSRTDVKPSANLQEVSRSEAAQMLSVSERSVNTAKKVQEKATPEVIEEVQSGRELDIGMVKLREEKFLFLWCFSKRRN
jgi:ParB-like chromosome segregation protein Spo0J